MGGVSRRFFLLSSAALTVGCSSRPAVETAAAAPLRQPAVGQSWRYSKHDQLSGTRLADEFDRVAAVGSTVEIISSNEAPKDAPDSSSHWGAEILHKYVHEKPLGALPSEIQRPWGMVLADPHWGQVQVYKTPIPLWPGQLRSGWKTHFMTKYKTPTNQSELLWDQTMRAREWQTISVPAGQFNTLRFTNMINFASSDKSRANSDRQETLWFAPEVGRWIARESAGSYYQDNSAVDTPYSEGSFRWELLEWT
jgi:hypothetical protein